MTGLTAELAAMSIIAAALDPLDLDAQRRVVTWVTSRFEDDLNCPPPLSELISDLDWHIEHWARKALDEGHGTVEAIASMVGAFVEHPDEYPRERLAPLLAAALARLANATEPAENGPAADPQKAAEGPDDNSDQA